MSFGYWYIIIIIITIIRIIIIITAYCKVVYHRVGVKHTNIKPLLAYTDRDTQANTVNQISRIRKFTRTWFP